MHNKLIPKKGLGGTSDLSSQTNIAKGMMSNFTTANPVTGKVAGFGSKLGAFGADMKLGNMKLDKFASSPIGGAVAMGTDMLQNALGIKPQYNLYSKLDKGLGMAESLSKNFGNPIVNAAGDFAANGLGKLMGLHTDKVVGGGMAGVNAVSNVLSNFGPIGMAASVALKMGNMAGGKNLSTLNADSRVQQSSGYTGSASSIKNTSDKYSGGMVSGIDNLFGTGRKYENRLTNARQLQGQVKGILNTADQNFTAQAGSTDMFRIRNNMNMQDNSYMYNGTLAVKQGGRIQRIIKHAEGGKMNIIPDGALHARRHSLDIDDITHKGIPVISQEEGGEITQHAEIEKNEIVFTKEVSDKLEALYKEYNEEGLSKEKKDLLAIQAGALLTFEIIENTDDKTGLITQVE